MIRNVFFTGMAALLMAASANASVILGLYVDPPTVANSAANGVTSTRSGAGTYQLYALDTSTTDFGIGSYDINILGVTSVLHRSPTTNISDNDPDNPTNFATGFALLRSSTTSNIQASEPLPVGNPYLVTGFGQSAGNFAAKAASVNASSSVVGPTTSGSWGIYTDPVLAPRNGHNWLFLAEGNYAGAKPTLGTVAVNALTVFADQNFTSALATTSVELLGAPVPEPASIALAGIALVGFVGLRRRRS